MDNTYVVTGGAGFIGSHLVEALVEQHQGRVFVIDNLSSGYLENLANVRDQITFHQVDIRNREALIDVMAGATHVFHEAALVSVFESVDKPEYNHEVNVTGTFNVLEAARTVGAKRVVLASTSAAYGNNPDLPKRETMLPEPESPYAIGKLTGEHYMKVFASLYGLETVVLRYFNVFGPRQDPSSFYAGVISKFAECFIEGQAPTIFGDGLQTRDFVFVKDVVQANLLAMQSAAVGKGEILNIGTSRSISLLDLVACMAELTGKALPPIFKPERAGDVKHSCADISRARTLLEYAPQYSLKQGLQALLDSAH